jgi:hypothetical protein
MDGINQNLTKYMEKRDMEKDRKRWNRKLRREKLMKEEEEEDCTAAFIPSAFGRNLVLVLYNKILFTWFG